MQTAMPPLSLPSSSSVWKVRPGGSFSSDRWNCEDVDLGRLPRFKLPSKLTSHRLTSDMKYVCCRLTWAVQTRFCVVLPPTPIRVDTKIMVIRYTGVKSAAYWKALSTDGPRGLRSKTAKLTVMQVSSVQTTIQIHAVSCATALVFCLVGD